MADTRHRTTRGALRREIAGTIGLLTDEQDFIAMRHYRTFTFDDHASYFQQVEALLRTLASNGNHTTVALFDPEEYAEFCAGTGLEPDAASSRTRFTAELASTGVTVPYEGQPLADLVPNLVDEAVRQATWEYATTLLSRIGNCASCGEDIGRAAFVRASELLIRVARHVSGFVSRLFGLETDVDRLARHLKSELPLFDAGVPEDEHAEYKKERGGERHAQRIGSGRERPDEKPRRTEKNHEPCLRYPPRPCELGVAIAGMLRGARIVGDRHAPAFRAVMFSRQ